MSVEDLFAKYVKAADKATIEDHRQASFEGHCVQRLLRYAGVSITRKEADRDAKTRFGLDYTTFRWFESEFPAFPMKIVSAKLRRTAGSQIGWTQLFGAGFAKLPWVQEYQKAANLHDCNPQEDRFALVFNAPHADKSATMVLHNQPLQSTMVVDAELREDTETRIIRPFGKPRIVYVIESFNSFMNTVGVDWAAHRCPPNC